MAPAIPLAPSDNTTWAPYAFKRLRLSILIVSGITRMHLYPIEAAADASPMPVFPLVGSIMVYPSFSKPEA